MDTMNTELFHHNKIYDECSQSGRELLRGMALPNQIKGLLDMKCFEVIDALHFNFFEGNCFKYIWRLGEKDSYAKDLEKIRRYAIAACERGTYYTVFHELVETLGDKNDSG